jgi:hypothetical protein
MGLHEVMHMKCLPQCRAWYTLSTHWMLAMLIIIKKHQVHSPPSGALAVHGSSFQGPGWWVPSFRNVPGIPLLRVLAPDCGSDVCGVLESILLNLEFVGVTYEVYKSLHSCYLGFRHSQKSHQ